MFWKKSCCQKFNNIHRKAPVLESLFILQAYRPITLLKGTPTQVFFCEYCGIFKTTYFEEHLWTAVSECCYSFSLKWWDSSKTFFNLFFLKYEILVLFHKISIDLILNFPNLTVHTFKSGFFRPLSTLLLLANGGRYTLLENQLTNLIISWSSCNQS